MMIEA